MMMQTTIEAPPEKSSNPQPQQAGWWQQFWWRYSPHGELPMSSVASWILHGLVWLLAWFAAMNFVAHSAGPPRVDVVSLGTGDGIGRGPAGGGDGQPPGEPGDIVASIEVDRLSPEADAVESPDDKIELPALPKTDAQRTRLKPSLEADGTSERQMRETESAIRELSDVLRRTLEANQNRGSGQGGSGGGSGTGKGLGLGSGLGPGTGRGTLDANSTPGRQARWIISYPTLPQSEYERMLDSFRIELAYLTLDQKTMQYLSNMSNVGKKRTGDAANEDRMFWYWISQNPLAQLDGSILRRHGLEPTSEVVHLYSKDLEQKLAEMEREFLRRQFKTADVDRITTTNFKIIPGGPGGWHLEVTGLSLR
jgi:hypothetical protein